jgi:hypothetical protein
MASTKISDMTAATNLTDAVIPIVQGGVNKKAASTLFREPYKVYTAILAQTGTGAPTATVLRNTFDGAITFTRVDVGVYTVVSDDSEFTSAVKTIMFANNSVSATSVIELVYSGVAEIFISTYIITAGTPSLIDDNLFDSNNSIEIRVYP